MENLDITKLRELAGLPVTEEYKPDPFLRKAALMDPDEMSDDQLKFVLTHYIKEIGKNAAAGEDQEDNIHYQELRDFEEHVIQANDPSIQEAYGIIQAWADDLEEPFATQEELEQEILKAQVIAAENALEMLA